MRIGILTFHRSINYGAYMQCFALSRKLRERYPNHEVEVIDFEYITKHKNYKKPIWHFPLGLEYYIKYRRFVSDLNYLNLSKESFITDNTDRLCEFIKSTYEVVIVGSDAVWAFQNKMPLDNPYWLFGNKLSDVIKMSYAASAFTTDFESVGLEARQYIKDCLGSFYYIGVRDDATYGFIKEIVGTKEVNLNHDPTFFLNPSSEFVNAKEILKKNLVFTPKKKMSFMTRKMPGMDVVRKKYYKEFGLLSFYVRDNTRKDLFDFRSRFLCNISPLEWYNVFCQIKLNVTYFFHGACIALVNHVPTIAIDDSVTNYKSKYSQLMLELGLADNLFYHNQLDIEKVILRMDYLLNNYEMEQQRISDAIIRERLKSISFFNALDSVLL